MHCDHQYLIGGTEKAESKTEEKYQIYCFEGNVSDVVYLVTSVRLFAHKLAPTFLVVTGKLPA